MGAMKEIAIECEGNLCYYCHKKIRAVGTERKNGTPKPANVHDREARWFHNACMKKRKQYYGMRDKLRDEAARGLPKYY